MQEPLPRYDEFALLSLSEKIDFVDNLAFNNLSHYATPSQLKRFFAAVFTDEKNVYLRRKALEILVALTFQSVLSLEFTKDFLLNEVGKTEDLFIQVAKIRHCFLLFGDAPSIVEELRQFAGDNEPEIATEAHFRLGLIALFYEGAGTATDAMSLSKARDHFQRAIGPLENRTDAQFFSHVIAFLQALQVRDTDSAATVFELLKEGRWFREVWGWLPPESLLEEAVFQSLSVLLHVAQLTGSERSWIAYEQELLRLKKLLNDWALKEVIAPHLHRTTEQFNEGVLTHYVSQCYLHNLSGIDLKLKALLAQSDPSDKDFRNFLQGLLTKIQAHNAAKDDEDVRLMEQSFLYHFPSLTAEDFQRDLTELYDQSKNFTAIQTQLIDRYMGRYKGNRTNYLTGYPQSEEELKVIKARLGALLPQYDRSKRAKFILVVADLLRYLFQSLTQAKNFFLPLYDSQAKKEDVFQRHLYMRLTNGSQASFYHLEDTGAIGGGRIDIVYREEDVVFPVEIKKTETPPTWESIQQDYLAQAQTYIHPYNQLGCLVVFDLSPKQNEAPVNNFRELTNLLHMRPLYRLSNRYPDYIFTMIVPGNKTSPSAYTTYR